MKPIIQRKCRIQMRGNDEAKWHDVRDIPINLADAGIAECMAWVSETEAEARQFHFDWYEYRVHVTRHIDWRALLSFILPS